jgi:predicted permease
MDAGFQTEGRIMATLDVSLAGDDSLDAASFYGELVDRVAALPGVSGVAASTGIPLGDWSSASTIFADDRPYGPDERGVTTWRSSVTDQYFDVLGTGMVMGRPFGPEDGPDTPGTVILNALAVERLWPGEDPLGRRIRFDREPGSDTYEVVGVVETGRYRQMMESPQPALFRPFAQSSRSRGVLTFRAEVDPIRLVAPMRQIVKEIDADVPIFDVKTADAHVHGALFLFRMGAEMAMALGVIALLLAAAGLYGVMTFRVGQRTHEMGIRLALGANKRSVLSNVLGGSLRLTAVGVAIGAGLALALSGILTSLLYGVTPRSPAHLGLVALGLGGVALMATLWPALSATRADPVESLRTE